MNIGLSFSAILEEALQYRQNGNPETMDIPVVYKSNIFLHGIHCG